eukprot:g1713.t1
MNFFAFSHHAGHERDKALTTNLSVDGYVSYEEGQAIVIGNLCTWAMPTEVKLDFGPNDLHSLLYQLVVCPLAVLRP